MKCKKVQLYKWKKICMMIELIDVYIEIKNKIKKKFIF